MGLWGDVEAQFVFLHRNIPSSSNIPSLKFQLQTQKIIFANRKRFTDPNTIKSTTTWKRLIMMLNRFNAFIYHSTQSAYLETFPRLMNFVVDSFLSVSSSRHLTKFYFKQGCIEESKKFLLWTIEIMMWILIFQQKHFIFDIFKASPKASAGKVSDTSVSS